MQNKIKVGLIGSGHLGKHHIKHLSKHVDIDFVGFFDTNKEIAKQVSGEFSVKSFENFHQLLDSVDAIHIVTPTNTHYEIAKECLNKKKDVFIEKPISTNYDQLDVLSAAVEQSNRKIYVGYNRPHSKAINIIKENFK